MNTIFANLLLINSHAKDMRDMLNADSVEVVYSSELTSAEAMVFVTMLNEKEIKSSVYSEFISCYFSNCTIKIYKK